MPGKALQVVTAALFAKAYLLAQSSQVHAIDEGDDWRQADGSDLAARRLTSCSASSVTMSGDLFVVKIDRFGTEQPFLDVTLVSNNASADYELRFPGTGNMAGNVTNLHGPLENGMAATVTCCIVNEAAEFHEEVCSEERRFRGNCTVDARPICIVQDLQGRRLQDSPGVDSGTAPAIVSVLVTMVKICNIGYTMAWSLNADSLYEMFHGSTAGTFATVLGSCSRQQTIVDSVIKPEPVEICPMSMDVWDIYTAVKDVLIQDEQYSSFVSDRWHESRLSMIIPYWYLDAAGVGSVGGSITWIREDNWDYPLIYLHEFGHNWRLHHAATLDAEYGDDTSAMGYCCQSRCFNFIHSWQLGYADYIGEWDASTLQAGSSFQIGIPDLGLYRNSGIKVQAYGKTYVLSYRGGGGFDNLLWSTQSKRVYVHTFEGLHEPERRRDSKKSIYLYDIQLNSRTVIENTELQLQFFDLHSNGTAFVRLCWGDGTSNCPGATDISTTSPLPEGTLPSWDMENSGWFDSIQGQEDSGTTTQAMVGLGCSGEYCHQLQTVRCTGVQLGAATAWETSASSIGMLQCPLNHGIAQIKCVESGSGRCGIIQVRCAMVQGGSFAQSHSTEFHPAELHSTELWLCPLYFVATGLRCAGTDCAKKSLTCQRFIPSDACTPSCSSLQKECGSDGCGGTCGSCSGLTNRCDEDSGRCVTAKLVGTSWASSNAIFGVETFSQDANWEGMIAAGMECDGWFCRKIRLRFMNIQVDGSQVDKSDWISDQDGSRFNFWYYGTDSARVQVADCPPGKAVSSVVCQGMYCNNIQLWCSKPYQWVIDQEGDPFTTEEWFSDEEGSDECPDHYVLTGLECKQSQGIEDGCWVDCDNYCDRKKLRCRLIHPENMGLYNLGVLKGAELESRQLSSADEGMVNAVAPRRHLVPLVMAIVVVAFFGTRPSAGIRT